MQQLIQLGSFNITQIDIPNRMNNAFHQVNPQELEDFLISKINYRFNSDAARVDAESIEKLVILRKGKKSTDLPKCGYIFVTHNTRYTRVSREYSQDFCGYSNFDTPPIVTLSTLTKLSWLASDKNNPDYDLSRGLLANCFQASLPDDKWYNKFWQTIEESHPELIDTDVHDSLYLLDVRAAAEETSLGSSALFDDIDFSVLIANAKVAKEEREQLHKKELQEKQLDNDLIIQRHKNKVESLKYDFDEKLKEADQKAKSEIGYINEEFKLKRDVEFLDLEKEHNKQLRSSVKSAEDEYKSSIEAGIASRAGKQARTVSIIMTSILAIIFSGIFILSLIDRLPTWIPVEHIIYIKVIAAILGGVQVIGLFVEKFSFLFLGPLFEKYLSTKLQRHYLDIISAEQKS